MNKDEIIDALLSEAETIQAFLEKEYKDNTQEMTERMTHLNAYMARSGKMLADAKLVQDRATNSAYAEHSKTIFKMPATVANKFVGSVTSQENYLVNWLERINRSCVHQADNMRTQISLAREQMTLERKGY